MIEFPQTQNLFEELDALTRRVAERAFRLFEDRGRLTGRDMDDWFRAESELLKPVLIEISESDESYVIRAEVPGFDAKDLSVQIEPTSICIHGKREEKKEEKKGKEVRYSEVSAMEVARRIDLPASINAEKVSAQLTNGILELTLPKAAPAKTIEIKVA